MPLALQEYCRRLSESGLLTAEEVAAFQSSLPPEKQPKDGQDLARELVKQKKLTEYQAISVYQGRSSTLVMGEYVVLDKIGSGGMGRVFKAEHRRMARSVAIKVMSEAAMSSPQAVKRFEQEVRTAARLEHPNIVTSHDAGEAHGLHYLVMQYVDGRDLKSTIRDKGQLSVETAVNYVFQAACGLEHAHLEGVIHRDIKPANLLVDKRGVVKVLDMGLARIEEDLKADDDQPIKGRLTVGNQTLGTADYMSPEQADDTRHADVRSDIYSLGCTLYYLLVGRPPYPGDTVAQTLMMHHNSPVPSLRKERADVPEALDAVFQRMVAKAPDDRYQTMSDVIVGLDACGVTIDLPQAVKVGGSSSGGFITAPVGLSGVSGGSVSRGGSHNDAGSTMPSRSDSSLTRTQDGIERPATAVSGVSTQGFSAGANPIPVVAPAPQQDAASGNEETVVFENQQADANPTKGLSATARRNKIALISAGVLLLLVVGLAVGVALLGR